MKQERSSLWVLLNVLMLGAAFMVLAPVDAVRDWRMSNNNEGIWVRFLFWLTGLLPCRMIDGDNGEPYLERYFVFRLFGFCLYIHRFLASDPDRGLHDHPWGWATSLVLAGEYDEIRMVRASGVPYVTQENTVRAGHFNFIRGDDFHRVVLPEGKSAWTLFFHGPRRKGWGFVEGTQYRPFALTGHDYPLDRWWRRAQSGREAREARMWARL